MNERVIVLGLGNLLCCDDGFGVHVIQRLQKQYLEPENCEIIDGGTQGQILYGILEEADKLLLVDAVDFEIEPGSLIMCGQNEIPAWLGCKKLSAHQSSFAEVLALGELKGVLPKEIWLLGFQAIQIDFGLQLSERAQAAIPQAEAMIIKWLAQQGISVEQYCTCRQ